LEHFFCGTKIVFQRGGGDQDHAEMSNELLPRKTKINRKARLQKISPDPVPKLDDDWNLGKSLPNLSMTEFFQRQPIGLWITPYSRTSTWN
jgi:hypothetical protein